MATKDFIVDWGITGLVGTLAYRILDSASGVLVARTTVGVTESVTESGTYKVTIDPWDETWVGSILWDDGSLAEGHTATETFDTSGSTPDPEYRYATQDDMVKWWGSKTMIEWTNLEPKQTTIDTVRLALAVFSAQDEIDRKLFNSQYQTPLVGMTASDNLLLKDWTCRIALVWLYDSRPGKSMTDEGKQKNQGRAIQKEVYRKLALVVAGLQSLSATRRTSKPTISGVSGSNQ